MQTPFSLLSFSKSFMKIRSAVPENGCLVFLWRTEKAKKQKKTYVKHIPIHLISGCVKKTSFSKADISQISFPGMQNFYDT